mmetsp:Transcript_107674/g.336754  ORF Transcript_107674/g.336754 Transcript_107674/m.336754 type:complete len:256 (-) Transcript_107674:10-777(-)
MVWAESAEEGPWHDEVLPAVCGRGRAAHLAKEGPVQDLPRPLREAHGHGGLGLAAHQPVHLRRPALRGLRPRQRQHGQRLLLPQRGGRHGVRHAGLGPERLHGLRAGVPDGLRQLPRRDAGGVRRPARARLRRRVPRDGGAAPGRRGAHRALQAHQRKQHREPARHGAALALREAPPRQALLEGRQGLQRPANHLELRPEVRREHALQQGAALVAPRGRLLGHAGAVGQARGDSLGPGCRRACAWQARASSRLPC